METFTSKEQALEMIKAQFSEEEISWIANHLLFSANPQCAEPEAPFTCYNNEDVLEEEEAADVIKLRKRLMKGRIPKQDAWDYIFGMPTEDMAEKLTAAEMLARLDKAQQDFAEGNIISEEDMDNYMDNLVDSLAS